MLKFVCTTLAVVSLSVAAEPSVRSIGGEYIEARTAEVWVGPCFANGEVEINGKEAILGWRIDRGEWQGVNLEGLSVAAVVRAEHTIGMVSEPVNPGRAVLIVDERATGPQRAALAAFAKSMAGDLIHEVVKVYYSPIQFDIEDDDIHEGAARLSAGSLAEVETRALNEGDVHCGNETIFYPPMSAGLEHSMPAYAETNTYQGDGLNERWRNPYKRSGFLGIFSVPSGQTETPTASN